MRRIAADRECMESQAREYSHIHLIRTLLTVTSCFPQRCRVHLSHYRNSAVLSVKKSNSKVSNLDNVTANFDWIDQGGYVDQAVFKCSTRPPFTASSEGTLKVHNRPTCMTRSLLKLHVILDLHLLSLLLVHQLALP